MADNSALPPGLENTAIIQGRTGTNKSENGALSTTDFLKFILSRIQQQDPLKHMENNQFLNPLAQFCAINGITDLKTAFDRFSTSLQSNHALLASTMVGRLALVAGDMVNLNAGSGAQGAVDLAASTGNLLVSISDASGQVLRTINLGSQPAGIVHFVWDGLTEAGRTAAPGRSRQCGWQPAGTRRKRSLHRCLSKMKWLPNQPTYRPG